MNVRKEAILCGSFGYVVRVFRRFRYVNADTMWPPQCQLHLKRVNIHGANSAVAEADKEPARAKRQREGRLAAQLINIDKLKYLTVV